MSLTVTICVVDYNENYDLTDVASVWFLADPASAAAFVEECGRRKRDELLLHKLGKDRGTSM